MKSKLGDRVRLEHIHECIAEIENALKGIKENEFYENHVLRIAVVKWLEIIGEAANHITQRTKDKEPHTDWINITGLRNIVAHEYFGINYETIWKIAVAEIPKLKTVVENLLKELE